jgi:hypothetical protein
VSTRAIAVKVALKAIADKQPIVSRDRIHVTYGFPTREPDRRWIAIGQIDWSDASWSTNRSRTESFSVTVVFSVVMRGGTSREAEAYAAEMARDFETALSADPSIRGLCITSGFIPRTIKSWPADGAYEAQFETQVTATCRP